MSTVSTIRPGRSIPSLTPPPSYSFRPVLGDPPDQSPSQEPRFVVGDFQSTYSNSSYGTESGYTPYESSFRIEVTHVQGKDLLDPPVRGQGWPRSPSPAGYGFNRPPERTDMPFDGSRGMGTLRFTLRLLILVASAVTIGLLTHSMSIYFRTKTINVSGVEPAWPNQVSLFPTYFLLSVAAVSLASSFVTLVQSFWHRTAVPISLGDKFTIILSGILIGSWIASAFIFEGYKKPDSASLVWWACYRKGGPADQLVGYDLVCAKHTAAQDMGIALNVLELFVLSTFGVTAYLNRSSSSSVDINFTRAKTARKDYQRISYV
ncbi:MAG: hypothetical protein M1830_000435 [Pleopsidium flavum]|nr:MAG: hypothetical protein M1830_000446 [Pleopsidium flavum]KAI9873422.1 MAG: hypothetical protein M1830_000435 [Pleopsidium flavum]